MLGARPESQRELPAGTEPSDNEAKLFADFARQYQITFQRQDLLKLALTHRSYLSVTGQSARESNERLEFLGDSVLGLVTSEFLYREHPTEHEGQLTKTKSLLVSKAILSRRALAMGLGKYVLMSRSESDSGGRQRLSILADAFESVIGAIYLDQGFETSREFIMRWLLRDSREIASDKRHTNYKSHLQEFVQSTFRTHPVYRIRSEIGPDHSKQFNVEVLVGRRVLGTGRGRNKKDAEQAAARDALAQSEGRKGEEPPKRASRERESGRTERESGRTERESGRPERESGRPERESGRPERERESGRTERDSGRTERQAESPRSSRESSRESSPAERPESPRAASGRAEAEEERESRRRGRRGGRGRRNRRDRDETTGGEESRETHETPRAAEPQRSPREAPRTGRDPGRGGRRDAREAEPRESSQPLASMMHQAGSPGRFGSTADDGDEIGRPEGPVEGGRVDPFGWDEAATPAAPTREEGRYVGGRTVGRLGAPGWATSPLPVSEPEPEPESEREERAERRESFEPEPEERAGRRESFEPEREERAGRRESFEPEESFEPGEAAEHRGATERETPVDPPASRTPAGDEGRGPSFGRRRSRR